MITMDPVVGNAEADETWISIALLLRTGYL
jgi:hypothetical protein